MALKNWIADKNRFGLAKPPAWWLQRLSDFDADLVLVPSRMEPLYRLARRARRSAGIGSMAVLNPEADTAMLAHYKLVPVTTVIRYGSAWDIDTILVKLADRDIWARKNGDKMADEIEAKEAKAEKALKASIRDDMRQRSKDAWRSLQARTGARNKRASDGNIAARESGQRALPSPIISVPWSPFSA